MTDPSRDEQPAASTRTVELVVAALVVLFGALVVFDSIRLGQGWSDDGPKAGYFPFYIGALICISGGVVFVRGFRNASLAAQPFVLRGQLALIAKVLVPTVIYVILIEFIGIYVASTIFIAFFMVWLGRYSWAKTLPVAIGVSVAFFLVFELWFHVPLPKGPLETMLGLA